MTVHAPPDGGGEGPDRLVEAFETFDSFYRQLSDLLSETRKGESQQAKKLAPLITEMGKALNRYATEAERIRDARLRCDGGVYQQSFDLDAARDAVRSRMARLRAARGSERADGGDGTP